MVTLFIGEWKSMESPGVHGKRLKSSHLGNRTEGVIKPELIGDTCKCTNLAIIGAALMDMYLSIYMYGRKSIIRDSPKGGLSTILMALRMTIGLQI